MSANLILISIIWLAVWVPTVSAQTFKSFQGDGSSNVLLAVGVHPITKALTGYFSGARISPERIDECKFAFSGRVNDSNSVLISMKDVVTLAENYTGQGQLSLVGNRATLSGFVEKLPADCDWILSFAGADYVSSKQGDVYTMPVEVNMTGDWQAVKVVARRKAFFYKRPDKNSKTKAFLVSGDLAYIFDERADWYFVKFKGEKKDTEGWMSKADMVNVVEK